MVVLLFGTGFFGTLSQWLEPYFHSEILLALCYFGILFIGADIIGLPFQWYHTFVLEERFGFNKTTPGTFFSDILLSRHIMWVLSTPVLFLLGNQFFLNTWRAQGVFHRADL